MTENFSGHELAINGQLLVFEQRIVKVIEFNGKIIVLLNSDDFKEGEILSSRNIIAYDKKGQLVWRIEDAGIKIRNRNNEYIPQPYLSLWVGRDGNTLHAGLGGVEVEVNPTDGTLIKMAQYRW